MYTTVAGQSHEVKLLAMVTGVAISSHNARILKDRTILAGTVNFHQVLINNSSCTDVEVTYL